MSDFQKQLSTHLGFIRRSCEEYDKGYTDEALRVAVSLRVLFHDTPKSTSLLKHLGKKHEIKLISTFVADDLVLPNAENVNWHTVIPLMITSKGVRPPLDTWDTRSILSIEEWWNERIWVEANFGLSRKDIVLSAANQDGGAHVDSNPSGKTKKAKQGPSVTIKINGKVLENGLINHHHPLLRQMAYEIVNSQELLELEKNT